jgi:hypothetical protein
MMVAIAYPKPQPGKRTDLLENSTGDEVDRGDLSQARVIAKWTPHHVEDILAGLARGDLAAAPRPLPSRLCTAVPELVFGPRRQLEPSEWHAIWPGGGTWLALSIVVRVCPETLGP